jgi:uncharacterized membrane protein
VSKTTTRRANAVAAAPEKAASTDWLRIAAIGLSIVGILVAGYMSWAELTGGETVCLDAGSIDCAAVQESAYAETLGIPVAVMGLLGYIAILAVLIHEDQVPFFAVYGRVLVIGFTLFGVLFSLYLTLIEATVLELWCQWCVISAILITALLIIGVYRWYRMIQPLRA